MWLGVDTEQGLPFGLEDRLDGLVEQSGDPEGKRQAGSYRPVSTAFTVCRDTSS